jgi:antitoxin component YwqK of YwqJK toxin-antitoxin module
MIFYPNSSKIKAKLYFQDGPLAAEGNYSQKDVKDSAWNYYSYYTKTLSRREPYTGGKLNGMCVSYFANGKVAEEREWKNGVSDGIWLQYYESGTVKMNSGFVSGKRNGVFVLNYPDGKPEWKGSYMNDKREGKWVNLDPTGNEILTIEYKAGVALNEAELNAQEQEILQQIDKQQGKIPEPSEEDMNAQPTKK